MKKTSVIFIYLSFVVSVACTSKLKAQTRAYAFPAGPMIVNSIASDELIMGGHSGLDMQWDKRGWFDVFIITDRGPNGKKQDFNGNGVDERPFVSPNFAPQILHFTYNPSSHELEYNSAMPLIDPQGKKMTGLPNEKYSEGQLVFDEEPVDGDNKELNYDPFGIDPESIALNGSNGFWVGEEYGPSLLKVSKRGEVLKRLVPKVKSGRRGLKVLPRVLARRKLNGGLEALAITGNSVYAFMQKPLRGNKKFVVVLELDKTTDQVVGLYAYPLAAPENRIGGATALPGGRIAVIEQNGDLYHNADQKLYQADFSQATNYINDPQVHQLKKALEISRGFVAKQSLIDLSSQGLFKFEKIEGVATKDGVDFYFVNDNDFNIKSIMENSSRREPNLFFHTKINHF